MESVGPRSVQAPHPGISQSREPDRDKEDKRRKEHPQLAPAWPVATTALARRLPLLVFVGTLGPANIAPTRTLVNVGIFQR